MGHFLLQIAMRSTQQTEIDRDRRAAPDPLNGLGFQRAQQLDLHMQWRLAYLVKKERAALGLFDQSNALRRGTGERALFMAKKLGFQQVGGNGPAIDRDHRPRAPGHEVHRIGNHFLARAGWSVDQDRHIARRDDADRLFQPPHHRRISDQHCIQTQVDGKLFRDRRGGPITRHALQSGMLKDIHPQ